MLTPIRILLVAIAVGATAIGVAEPAQASPSSPDDVAIVLQNINAARIAAGAPAVATDPRVTAVAQRWAETLESDQLAYHNPTFGQELAPATQAGEVISQFSPSGGVVAAWMNSSTHRGILLNSTWNAVGIAFIPDPDTGYFWAVVDFAYYPPVVAAPPAPATVDMTLSDRDAVVTWAPVAGSSDPSLTRYDAYDVDLYDASTGSMLTGAFPTFPATSSSYPGLQRGRSYFARVRAYVNGMWGPTTQSPTVTVATLAPEAITRTSIYGFDATSVNTSWWATPNDNGSPVTSYTVTLYRDGVRYGVFSTPEAGRMFSGLPQGSSYAFTVAATNGAGTSPESTMSASASLPVIPAEGGPSTISLPTTDVTSLPVEPVVTSVAQDVPDLPIVLTPPSSVRTEPSTPATTAPVVVTPAPNAAATPKPRPVAPARPLTPTMTGVRVGKSAVALTWRPAGTSKASVLRYLVTIRRVGTSQVHTYRTSASRTGLALTGLRRHTAYRVTVTAYSSKTHTVAPARTVRTR